MALLCEVTREEVAEDKVKKIIENFGVESI